MPRANALAIERPKEVAAFSATFSNIEGGSFLVAAIDGETGVMMTINRAEGDAYSTYYEPFDISKIANEVRHVPDEYINAEGNGITDAGIEYLRPLIIGELDVIYEEGLPKHIVL